MQIFVIQLTKTEVNLYFILDYKIILEGIRHLISTDLISIKSATYAAKISVHFDFLSN